MFKKIQDWLFKEDYEELDIEDKDDYIEEVVYEDKRRKPEPKPKETVVYEETIPYIKPVAPKMNIDIKVDDPIVVDEKKVAPTPVKTRMTLTRKDEFEMPPVISPYFGVKGEEPTSTSLDALQVDAMKTNSGKKEAFNSVISPFYGQKKSQKPIQQTTPSHENPIKSSVFITADIPDTTIESDFDEDNISLDEIVSTNEVNADDLIQFSLFGEDKKIQKEMFDNEDSETIEEVEELPF